MNIHIMMTTAVHRDCINCLSVHRYGHGINNMKINE